MCLILSKQYMFYGNIKKATYFNHVSILRSLVCLYNSDVHKCLNPLKEKYESCLFCAYN